MVPNRPPEWTPRKRREGNDGASGVEQFESNIAAAEIELSDDEYAALSAASDRFRPTAGRAALPAIVRDRLRR